MVSLFSRKALALGLVLSLSVCAAAAQTDEETETWLVASQRTDGQSLFERWRFSAAVADVLRLPCPQRMRMLDDMTSRSNRYSGEAGFAAAVQAHVGECGRRNGELQKLAASNFSPARQELRALQRLSTFVGAANSAGAGPLANAAALLPRSAVARAGVIGPCTQTELEVDVPATLKRFETEAVGEIAVSQAFVYWGAAALGERGLCEGPAQRNVVSYHVNWPAIVSAWQATSSVPASGVLSERDVESFVALLSNANAQLQASREKADRLARAAAAQFEQQEAANRRNAEREEREFASYLTHAQTAQAIYLKAGKYERENQPGRAVRLYEYLTENHQKSEYAVKANDRLLQMKADAQRSARASDQSAANDDARRRAAIMGATAAERVRDGNAQFQRDLEQAERGRVQREREEADFIQRRNEQIRRQQEQWEAEERQRRMQQP